MTATKRSQSKIGESEATPLVRELTGWDARRRVRQHDGDSDLMGVPGWSIEVKRHRSASRTDIARWWAQAVTQAGELLPMLLCRVDRGDWRAVGPLAVGAAGGAAGRLLAERRVVGRHQRCRVIRCGARGGPGAPP